MDIYLKFPNTASRLIEVKMQFKATTSTVVLQLPLWRPGRYEFQNYAKNIMYFMALGIEGQILEYSKQDRNTWCVICEEGQELQITYAYYAQQLDAGGSYIDDTLVYLNPVNFCMSVQQHTHDIKLHVELPSDCKVSAGVGFSYANHREYKVATARFASWYELYDTPIIASSQLLDYKYEVAGVVFTLWFYGLQQLAELSIIMDAFTKFTSDQLELFGSFPFEEYHFQYIIVPYKYYHGVEHRNSTVIVLGSTEDFVEGKLYDDFLGISSHELFHAWNICKIRPQELFPYNYNAPAYFTTGFVAEGFTTYYGDYILYRSGVISKELYEKELEAIIKRHCSNPGSLQYSLAESSLDLWVDGYQPSHPERKVSIYDKGALVSFILDSLIEVFSEGKYSLDHVLKSLWHDFALQGRPYTEPDIRRLLCTYGSERILEVYEECVFGKTFLNDLLRYAIEIKGLQIDLEGVCNGEFQIKGYVCAERNGKRVIEKVNPQHPSYNMLSVNDEIVSEMEHQLIINRNGRQIMLNR